MIPSPSHKCKAIKRQCPEQRTVILQETLNLASRGHKREKTASGHSPFHENNPLVRIVRLIRLELTRLSALDPKSSVSTIPPQAHGWVKWCKGTSFYDIMQHFWS